MSRAMELASLPIRVERARARLFPPSKWAGLFPSAAYRRPAPAQLAGDILNPCRVGCFGVACVFSQGKRPAGNQIHADLYCKPEGLSPDGGLSYPTSTKPHQTREPRGLLPSGGKPAIKLLSSERSARIARSPGSRGTAPCASRGICRATAVKPRPSRMSPYTPARIARSPKGAQPPCRRELGSLPSRRTARK